jgi:hypothetical protein
VTHLCLRKFNTREAYPDQKLDNDVCMARPEYLMEIDIIAEVPAA